MLISLSPALVVFDTIAKNTFDALMIEDLFSPRRLLSLDDLYDMFFKSIQHALLRISPSSYDTVRANHSRISLKLTID